MSKIVERELKDMYPWELELVKDMAKRSMDRHELWLKEICRQIREKREQKANTLHLPKRNQ